MVQIRKPELFFQPRHILRRLQGPGVDDPGERVAMLPWGLPLRVRNTETIGRLVLAHGLFDIVVCEVLWRLAGSGEWALDVGANIGHMTGLLARRVGPSGRVWSFEPHPAVRNDLQRHVDSWRDIPGMGPITVHAPALADAAGVGRLHVPECFEENRGLASLTGDPGGLAIELATLDSLMPPDGSSVGVMKMDVEGAEERVLMGAAKTLESGRVRDLIFEDHEAFPSAVARRLQGWGFHLFTLRAGILGPVARVGGQSTLSLRSWDSPSLLATREPGRAKRLLGPRGWRCLHGESRYGLFPNPLR